MAHLDSPEPDLSAWTDDDRASYEGASRLDGLRRSLAMCPSVAAPFLRAYTAAFDIEGGLTRTERELVAAVVAITNRCATLAEQHLSTLVEGGLSQAAVDALRRDYRLARLEPRSRALLDYTVLVNDDVHLVSKATLDELRQNHGLQTADLVLLTHIIGLGNHLSRMFTAFGQ